MAPNQYYIYLASASPVSGVVQSLAFSAPVDASVLSQGTGRMWMSNFAGSGSMGPINISCPDPTGNAPNCGGYLPTGHEFILTTNAAEPGVVPLYRLIITIGGQLFVYLTTDGSYANTLQQQGWSLDANEANGQWLYVCP
jgi:hypothetical protein